MPSTVDIRALLELSLADRVEQLRAVPVRRSNSDGLLLVHSAQSNIDPHEGLFTLPDDSLQFAFVTRSGDIAWRRDLGPGIVPGVWFCPVFPFDLDGDGTEEVWYVDNVEEDHPLSPSGHRLARIDPTTGETTGRWPWPDYVRQPLGPMYRNFIFGGHANGAPVLVTAQGTYGPMKLQGWNPDMSRRWEHRIGYAPSREQTRTWQTSDGWVENWQIEPADDAGQSTGPRGSHVCPVLDIDGDGVDEVLWGERAVELDGGTELFCVDQWDDHSDIIQPTWRDGEWYIFTCRERQTDTPPRVVTFDATGERVWSALEQGHMHVGWTARLDPDGEQVAMAGRGKGAIPEDRETFAWNAYTGEPRDLPAPLYSTMPVDVDGDGRHELVYRHDIAGEEPSRSDRWGTVVDGTGRTLGRVEGRTAKTLPSKWLDHPGEQIVTYTTDGTVRVWGDVNATDTDCARARYDHPYYRKAQRLSAVGYNRANLGGL